MSRRRTARTALVALFVTALVTAQLTASKVLAVPLPVSVGPVGSTVFLPGAALAYALTFFASDCYAELYGKRDAQVLVNVGFVMNFVLLALVWSTILVAGSLLAYVVSQNWDVLVFHALRDRTEGSYLWLRNIGSTATSQAIDTVLFVSIAFFAAPTLLGTGQALPVSVLVALVVGQYLLKLLIALVDTPFVYAVVRFVSDGTDEEPANPWTVE